MHHIIQPFTNNQDWQHGMERKENYHKNITTHTPWTHHKKGPWTHLYLEKKHILNWILMVSMYVWIIKFIIPLWKRSYIIQLLPGLEILPCRYNVEVREPLGELSDKVRHFMEDPHVQLLSLTPLELGTSVTNKPSAFLLFYPHLQPHPTWFQYGVGRKGLNLYLICRENS